ncbi:putative dnaJ subfamily B member 14 [Paratrimastix pyriformis]|uniref:DnaJ subfamily B member 14 n=1 Tax=Paratrimastix pyriformis TaxID=342808 RepID=A0ABQ8UPD2_9EUKA|nr:putative dnaJ subfamily B member 14 [Paratrimastix pyriformis]
MQRRGAGVPPAASPSGSPINIDSEIRRILRTKDYYDILGIPRTATEAEITKAYRKVSLHALRCHSLHVAFCQLALKLHPDKCKAENATEAFKAVSRAASTLTNEQEKAEYDKWGPDGPPQQRPVPQHPRAQQPMTEEELFRRMFFMFQGMQPDDDEENPDLFTVLNNVRRRSAGGQVPVRSSFGHLMPLLLVLGFLLLLPTLFSSRGSSSSSRYSSYPSSSMEDMISFEKNRFHSVKRTTWPSRVDYWVSPMINNQLNSPWSRSSGPEFDNYAEDHFRKTMQTKCERERQNLSASIDAALTDKKLSPQEREKAAQKAAQKMPSCEQLKRLKKR